MSLDFNSHVAALALGKVERVEWTNDGYSMDGVLTYPPEFTAGNHPLNLVIHGGPHSASKETFNTLTTVVAHGHAVSAKLSGQLSVQK